MDPYWAGALAHTVMAIMSLAGLLINRKFKKRPVYLTCCAILCFGTTTLATYFYLNKNEYLKLNYPWTGWLPIISVTLIYTSKALGIGSITHMLQVLSTLEFRTFKIWRYGGGHFFPFQILADLEAKPVQSKDPFYETPQKSL